MSQIYDNAPGTLREKRLLISEDMLDSDPVVSRGTYFYSNNGYVVRRWLRRRLVRLVRRRRDLEPWGSPHW
jgi:hypothetical protein